MLINQCADLWKATRGFLAGCCFPSPPLRLLRLLCCCLTRCEGLSPDGEAENESAESGWARLRLRATACCFLACKKGSAKGGRRSESRREEGGMRACQRTRAPSLDQQLNRA